MAVTPNTNHGLRIVAVAFGILLLVIGVLGLAYSLLAASSVSGMMAGMMGGAPVGMVGSVFGPAVIVAVLLIVIGGVLLALGRR
ncbi:MAG: hypothetical protein ACYDAG_12550 [Chloroflexota bacterium]